MAVTVRINATDGDNEGFTFMGSSGLSMTSGTLASYYGGLLFGYNSSTVRLWAPSNFTFGGIVNINQGFGSSNLQTSRSADVRVEVSPMVAADFDSGWFEMGKSRAQHDVRHGLGDLTYSIVRVYVRVRSGENEGFIFEGVEAAQTMGVQWTLMGEWYLPTMISLSGPTPPTAVPARLFMSVERAGRRKVPSD